MTKDKYKYIEGLLRNYKKNKSRIKILELGLVTDDDYTLGAIDYSNPLKYFSYYITLQIKLYLSKISIQFT